MNSLFWKQVGDNVNSLSDSLSKMYASRKEDEFNQNIAQAMQPKPVQVERPVQTPSVQPTPNFSGMIGRDVPTNALPAGAMNPNIPQAPLFSPTQTENVKPSPMEAFRNVVQSRPDLLGTRSAQEKLKAMQLFAPQTKYVQPGTMAVKTNPLTDEMEGKPEAIGTKPKKTVADYQAAISAATTPEELKKAQDEFDGFVKGNANLQGSIAQAKEDVKPEKPPKKIGQVVQPNGDAIVSMLHSDGTVEKINIGKQRNTGSAGDITDNDAESILQQIKVGKQPPDSKGMYRAWAKVRVAAAKDGYDLTTAEKDWNGITKHITTLNGAQQERLRQAITFADGTLPQLEKAYNDWKEQAGISGIKVLNKANMIAMKNLPGKAGSAAQQLESLMADYTSELGTVYRGGNSSTDESLKLAAQNLSGDWNEETFNDALKRLKTSIGIRKASIYASMPVGVSENSPLLNPNGQVKTDTTKADQSKNWWE